MNLAHMAQAYVAIKKATEEGDLEKGVYVSVRCRVSFTTYRPWRKSSIGPLMNLQKFKKT